MRIAIYSDIHGNIHALDPVLQDIERKEVDRRYCLGALVGYAAFSERSDRTCQGLRRPDRDGQL